MSHEVELHAAQVAILRVLLFQPTAGFAELQKQTDLASDHFKFHVARLVELDMIAKTVDAKYTLTQKGKEYANKLDTDNNTIERQPKTSVILLVERQDGDRREFLVQQRLKQPFFGYYGRLGGKVRWGERLVDAARRELLEETGLTISKLDLRVIYHKIDVNAQTRELLEDKVFYVFYGQEPDGELTADFEGGRNMWMTNEELASEAKHFVTAVEYVELVARPGVHFIEKEFPYELADY